MKHEPKLSYVFDIIKILGGTVKATKKWPTLTTDLVPAGITEKLPFLRFAEKRKTGQKSVFKKKHPKSAKRLIFYLTLPSRGKNMVSIY